RAIGQARGIAAETRTVRRASCCSITAWLDRDEPLGGSVPWLEATHDVCHGEIGCRDDRICGSVVHPDVAVAEVDVAAGEDRVVEQAHTLVCLGRLGDRR